MTRAEAQAAWPPQEHPTVSPDGPASAPRRSGWIVASAVILFVVAGLSALIALILVIAGLLLGPALADLVETGMPGGEVAASMTGIFTAVMLVFGVIALVWGGAHTAVGIGVLGGREWARITGMVLAVIGLLLSALWLAGTLGTVRDVEAMMADPAFADLYPGMTADDVVAQSILFGLLFGLPFVIGYLVVLVTLIRSGRYFAPAWRRPATSVGHEGR